MDFDSKLDYDLNTYYSNIDTWEEAIELAKVEVSKMSGEEILSECENYSWLRDNVGSDEEGGLCIINDSTLGQLREELMEIKAEFIYNGGM